MPSIHPTVSIVLPFEELLQMRVVLDRAMNTWEPNKQPEWLPRFSAEIDRIIGLVETDPVRQP